MTSTKTNPKKNHTYNPAAKPPVRLSKEDRDLLENLKPNTVLMDYVANLSKLKIIDGATCGL
jgi:hypothetical protein